MTIIAYSLEKQIPKTTFADWVYKYKNSRNAFMNGSNSYDSVDFTTTITPTCIEISKDKLADKIEQSSSTIKPNYKDASLELNINELEKIMEILKRW